MANGQCVTTPWCSTMMTSGDTSRCRHHAQTNGCGETDSIVCKPPSRQRDVHMPSICKMGEN